MLKKLKNKVNKFLDNFFLFHTKMCNIQKLWANLVDAYNDLKEYS